MLTCARTNSVNVVYFDSRTWYKPYGEIRAGGSSLPTDFTYTGQRSDSYIKLVQMGARWYDPVLARFLGADTVAPEPGNPQALNRYSYCLGNPVKYTDPTGHFEDDAIKDYLRKKYGDGWEDVWKSWIADQDWMDMLHAAEGGDVLAYLYAGGPLYFRFAGEGQTLLEDTFLTNDIVGSEDVGLYHLWWIYGLSQDFHRAGVFYLENDHLQLRYADPNWDIEVREVTTFENALFKTMLMIPLALIPAGGALALAKHIGMGLAGWGLGELITKYVPGLKPGNDVMFVSNSLEHSLTVTLDKGVVVSSSISHWEWPETDIPLP